MREQMQRREFLRRAALVTAGVVAADQLDVLDRLGWTRKFFPSAALTPNPERWGLGFRISASMEQDALYGAGLQRLMDDFQRETRAIKVGRTWDFDTNDIVVNAFFDRRPTHVEGNKLWKMHEALRAAMV